MVNAELETDECDFLRRLLVCSLLLCPDVDEKMAEFRARARFFTVTDSEDSGGMLN